MNQEPSDDKEDDENDPDKENPIIVYCCWAIFGGIILYSIFLKRSFNKLLNHNIIY